MKPRITTITLLITASLLMIPTRDYGQSGSESRELRTVVIDPGHGGSDPGAVAGGVKEKDLVLAIGLRLGDKIKKNYPDVKVIYTRSKDVFIPLHVRASMAVKNKADLFISLHANYVKTTAVRGTETFTLGLHRSQENLEVAKKENAVILLEEDYSANYEGFNPNETESYIMFENMQAEYQTQSIGLAAYIQNEFTRNLSLVNRGVKQAGFLVLRQTTMPGVLVEVGFISNPEERKFLVSEGGKEKVAESIFKAFSIYKKEIDSKSRFTLQPVDEVADATPPGPAAPEKRGAGNTKTAATPTSAATDTKPAGDSGKTATFTLTNVAGSAKPAPEPAVVTKPDTVLKKTEEKNTQETNHHPTRWFSVQVGAVSNAAEPSPANFKGEQNIYRIRVAPYYKFFSGKFSTVANAVKEKKRLTEKFPEAFVVVIENDIPRAVPQNELP